MYLGVCLSSTITLAKSVWSQTHCTVLKESLQEACYGTNPNLIKHGNSTIDRQIKYIVTKHMVYAVFMCSQGQAEGHAKL